MENKDEHILLDAFSNKEAKGLDENLNISDIQSGSNLLLPVARRISNSQPLGKGKRVKQVSPNAEKKKKKNRKLKKQSRKNNRKK